MSKKVTFTDVEYNRLCNVVGKLLVMREKITDKDWKKGNNPIIKDLSKKFYKDGITGQTQSVQLKRPHLRFLEEGLKQSIETLEVNILPEYKKRFETKPDENDYKEYIERLERHYNEYFNRIYTC
jgi:hypothetical protein